MLLKCCPVWPLCRRTKSSENLLPKCFCMLKHFLATFVVQFNVSQFGHNVGQQFNSTFQMIEVNMRSVEVRTLHSQNKMAAAPLLDLNGVDKEAPSPEGENHGEEDGDGRIPRLPRLRIHALVLLPFFQRPSSSKASSNSKQAAAFFRSAMF